MKYTKEITDSFLIKYKELETLKENDYEKFAYLNKHFKSELDLFRRMRNELSHNELDGFYPFAVSESSLILINKLLNLVEEKVFAKAKKENEIIFVKQNNTLKEVIYLMSKYNYSFLPIIDNNGSVIGIVSSDTIIDIINQQNTFSLNENDTIEKYINLFKLKNNDNEFYIFISKNTYLYALEEILEKYQNEHRKLGLILITHNGFPSEKLIGIMTPWDLIKK